MYYYYGLGSVQKNTMFVKSTQKSQKYFSTYKDDVPMATTLLLPDGSNRTVNRGTRHYECEQVMENTIHPVSSEALPCTEEIGTSGETFKKPENRIAKFIGSEYNTERLISGQSPSKCNEDSDL